MKKRSQYRPVQAPLQTIPKRRILPANPSPVGALPRRFRQTRLLIVGCGDVGLRVVQQLAGRAISLLALTSSADKLQLLRQAGVKPLLGNLDALASLRRLSNLAHRVLHLAPPPNADLTCTTDPRTRVLLQALRQPGSRQKNKALHLVYGSTTGVYGDCAGQLINETRAVNPATSRAKRRVDAEQQLRQALPGLSVHILRIPGIYAPDREGGTPSARLQRGLPVLLPADDVYTSHIHADDLARACMAALWRGKPQRISHAVDDTRLKMGDYMDFAADLYQLPRPPRVSRAEAEAVLPAMQLSFLRESRQLSNQRLKTELRLVLHYPTVAEGLARNAQTTPATSKAMPTAVVAEGMAPRNANA